MITAHEQVEIDIDGNVVKVDKGLEHIIKYLNECGCKTLYSCIDSGCETTYFCFSSYESIFRLIKDKHLEYWFNDNVKFGFSPMDDRTSIYFPSNKLKEFETKLFKVYEILND